MKRSKLCQKDPSTPTLELSHVALPRHKQWEEMFGKFSTTDIAHFTKSNKKMKREVTDWKIHIVHITSREFLYKQGFQQIFKDKQSYRKWSEDPKAQHRKHPILTSSESRPWIAPLLPGYATRPAERPCPVLAPRVVPSRVRRPSDLFLVQRLWHMWDERTLWRWGGRRLWLTGFDEPNCQDGEAYVAKNVMF